MTQNSWHSVTNAEAAQALLEPETLRNLAVFFEERSLAQAAQQLGQPASSLKYHLDKFVAWGLVVQTRSQPRRGKPSKYFQTVTKHFFIPFAITKQDSMTELLKSLQMPLLEQYCTDFVRAGQRILPEASNGGMCIQALEHGRHSIDFSVTPPPHVQLEQRHFKPLWNSWTTIHLSAKQADDLHKELEQLWTRVLHENSREHEKTKPFTLHLGLTPQS